MDHPPGTLRRFPLETVHSREDARRRLAFWREKAQDFPGAEVRALTIPDPLGGVMVMLYSKNVDLIPPEVRQRQDEAVRRRLAELRRHHGLEEDRGAIEAASKALAGKLPMDIEALERSMDDYEQRHPREEWELETSGEDEP